MKYIISLLTGLLLTTRAFAEPSAEPIPLWPEGAPGALGKEAKDIPTITPYLADPAKANGSALIIFPGGAYAGLAAHEGAGYAEFFREQGIHCFVVKYRLGTSGYRHPRMMEDGLRSVRLVRSKAAEWKIDTNRVGIIGSSAGGHLASTIATHFDTGKADASDPIERQSSRPDFAVLCYAVITMTEMTHGGSRRNLLGENPSQELINELSNELHVTKDTPPCFVWTTGEDKSVKPDNSFAFAMALQKAGVPYDFHVYEKGPHGIGLGKNLPPGKHHPWADDCVFWLHERGILK